MAAANSITLECSRCKQTKPLEEFRRRPNRPESGKRLGRWSHCHDCERERRLSPRGRELQGKRMRKFRQKLRDTDIRELRRRERQDNLRRLYGISIKDYDAMLAAQDGKCAICRTPPVKGRGVKLHVDHCHATGKVRGLLCDDCNFGLGKFKDDVKRMEAAIKYLTEHMTVTVPIS